MNILLIDDDQDSRSCVAEFLSQLGHYVVECDNGLDGLGIFKGSQFHMVLSDIKMPRMSGIDLLLDTPLNREQVDLSGTALDSANLLLKIINDILDFSKIESGKMK
jgi:CheY-like chemotaxis protein